MRRLSTLAVIVLIMQSFPTQSARSEVLQLEFITQFCNEAIATADIASDPRMLRNISNSLMTDAPSFLDQAIYLQRRTGFNLCPELTGIGEVSEEWLRPNRVSLSKDAVVIAAVREDLYAGAAALLFGSSWTALGETITLDYVEGVADIPLYSGLVPAGPVSISGSSVNQLGINPEIAHASHYFFFQETDAFSPEILAQLQTVPEPGSLILLLSAALSIISVWLSQKLRQRSQAGLRAIS